MSSTPLSFLNIQSERLPLLIGSALATILTGLLVKYSLRTVTIQNGEPPLFPGALPLLGHVIEYAKDANKVYERASLLSKARTPVSLSLLGKRLYVVVDIKDVTAAWRAKTLSFDGICEWGMVTLFGMSAHGANLMHDDPDGMGDMYENQHKFWREGLSPGENLNSLTTQFLYYLEANIEELEKTLPKDNSWTETQLLSWTRDRIGVAATNAIAGPNLLEIDPDIPKRLTQWESEFFLLALGLPKWVFKKATDNLERMVDSFVKLGVDPAMMPLLYQRTQFVLARRPSERDVASTNLSFWLGTQANANPSAFWVVYQILRLPAEMRAKIEAEIAPAFDPVTNRLVDLDHLVQNMPLLGSIYWEVLRITAGSVSVREVAEDTIVGGYRFCKGGMVMLPLRLNHMNEDVWGDDVEEFVADRFIRDVSKLPGNKKNPGIKALKPFGGGTSLCPGRHFALNEIFAYVATVLRRFDIELVEGQKEAVPLMSAPSVGVLPPDQDVRVRIRTRKFWSSNQII